MGKHGYEPCIMGAFAFLDSVLKINNIIGDYQTCNDKNKNKQLESVNLIYLIRICGKMYKT